MAAVATASATAVAMVLAPVATWSLSTSTVLEDPAGRSALNRCGLLFLLLVRATALACRSLPELVRALAFVLWVGPGPFAGALAIGMHTVGILTRLFAEAYDDAELEPARALEASGGSRFTVWAFGLWPHVKARVATYAWFRFEVNVRQTAMVGFVGAGGIGNAIHTAISLFHFTDLSGLLLVLIATVITIDGIGAWLRGHLLGLRAQRNADA